MEVCSGVVVFDVKFIVGSEYVVGDVKLVVGL